MPLRVSCTCLGTSIRPFISSAPLPFCGWLPFLRGHRGVPIALSDPPSPARRHPSRPSRLPRSRVIYRIRENFVDTDRVRLLLSGCLLVSHDLEARSTARTVAGRWRHDSNVNASSSWHLRATRAHFDRFGGISRDLSEFDIHEAFVVSRRYSVALRSLFSSERSFDLSHCRLMLD